MDNQAYQELLGPFPLQEQLRLLQRFREVGTADKDELLVVALTVKAGLEAADGFERELHRLVEDGETATYQLEGIRVTLGQSWAE